MKFVISGPLKDNVYHVMRRAGYSFEGKDEARGESVFARPPRGYPRFHLFIKQEENSLVVNLHLDQKKPSYKGTTAHSGEYEGGMIEAEAKRIEAIMRQ